MASPTKKTELIRERKEGRMGQKRKSKERNQGTTKSKKALFGDDNSK